MIASKLLHIFCTGKVWLYWYFFVFFSWINQSKILLLTSLYWSKNIKKSFHDMVSFMSACAIHFWIYEGLQPFNDDINWAIVSIGSYCFGFRFIILDYSNRLKTHNKSAGERSNGWKGFSKIYSYRFIMKLLINYHSVNKS